MTNSEAAETARRVTFYTVIACWWVFGLTFWLRKRPPKVQETKRDPSSLFGLALQALAYLLVWLFPLNRGHFFSQSSALPIPEWLLAPLTILLAVSSVWLVNSAARRLGKQWALTARVVEGHNLIQDGPYGFVRNPIYTGMLGILVATGMASRQWIPLVATIIVFLIGTFIRVRSEEKILREAFGADFETYERKVPALIPGLY